MQRINASFAVGLNCPVSMELMVFRDTPTISASCACERFFSERASFSLFCSFSSSLHLSKPQEKQNKAQQAHGEI